MFLESERLYLRALEKTDVPNYQRWVNDPMVYRYLMIGLWPLTADDLLEYMEENRKSDKAVLFAVVVKEGDVHIGNIRISGIDWVHRRATRGIMLGEKDCWGKGYAKEALELLNEYAFDRLGLHKIGSTHIIDNVAMSFINQKLGFVLEGIHRQELFRGGEYHDVAIWGLLADEWRKRK